MSAEYAALLAREQPHKKPEGVRPGDLYIDDRVGSVMFVLKHRGRRKALNWVWLYCCGNPSLQISSGKLREGEWQGTPADAWLEWCASRGEPMRYAGNIFDQLPLRSL